MIKVYIVRYQVAGKQVTICESVDKDTAFAIARKFARLGHVATISRFDVTFRSLSASCQASFLIPVRTSVQPHQRAIQARR